jgi:DNA-binding MarR family transcriptional regulator
VSLTKAGTRRLAEIEDLSSGVEQRVLSALSAREQSQLYRLLSHATASPNCVEAVNEQSCLQETE